jgi:Flavin-binding monooxygenase-like
MNNQKVKIAIIGAGWMGVGCARMLIKAGYEIDIFEINSDVGGVWHPQNHYSGLEIHSYAKNVEFFDFPLPSFINKADRITALQVYNYLCDYCRFHNLYEYLSFNTYVERINYNSITNEYELFTNNVNTNEVDSKKYTHVIYTHGFCEKSIPKVKSIEKFLGKAIHSFHANQALMQSIIQQNKKVIIVGGSKTATDLILQFQKHAYQVSWLYRKNYWFLNRNIMHNLLDQGLQSKVRSFFTRFILKGSDFCASIHPDLAFYYMRIFNLIHTFGKKHGDFKKFHNGALDENQIKLLRHYNSNNHIHGQIKSFYKEGVILDNNSKLKTDYVIFCTGSGPCQSLIEISIDGKRFEIESVKKVYRARIIPKLPNLVFTSFSPFATGVVNGLCYGNWIIQYINSNLSIESLEKGSTTYTKPFFREHLLFDSSEYIVQKGLELLESFFTSGELCRNEFEKWHLQNTFSTNAAKPLTFKKPNVG